MNIGIVGAGKIVKEALPVMEQIPEFTFQSIVSSGRNPENVKNLQKQFNIKTIFDDYEQFIQDEMIDIIYLAVPNHLHFDYARKAIQHHKHVICEKPFTLTKAELVELKDLAQAHEVIIIEAITNLYLSNFEVLKQSINELGNCKIAQFNYSQYSSRYDNFKEGIIAPAFDPSKGGGALMDINVYNIHLAVGLFGKPEGVAYFANIQNNIDTSGILQLDYNDMKVVCIGAKDSSSDNQSYIQGDQAMINIKGPTNELTAFELKYNQGGTQAYQVNPYNHRMYEEFVKIAQIIKEKNFDVVAQKLEHSIHVVEVLEQALDSANIKVGPSQKQ
ncbi:Gfo/Idh/MocA family protein [Staphylococcus edaphicus]|uniref:Gfo/Idh/MocA family oxidoreductase n=1 Tax=Staphylococcus edaphicus TaxID=1955013 RepID=A0A2C6WPE3_9STAP|nr:Gfo/Idh/MocA family oxidoreductase [Staphylococcus edaphicus]PHK50003.1 NAD(P)-dependent oxidoreductase [Staphylococcus edaphicus]UQW81737.1 Gfo/Idh/MocA family oxidoreductase [Staphylococcus edaphicus]